MNTKLLIIGAFGALLAMVYVLCMRSVPGKGWMLIMEKLCMGIILCYLCQLAVRPWGLSIAQSPLAALSAGYWGIPGMALSTFLAHWP